MKLITSIEWKPEWQWGKRRAEETGVVMCLKCEFYFNVDLMNFSWDLVNIREQPFTFIRCKYTTLFLFILFALVSCDCILRQFSIFIYLLFFLRSFFDEAKT